MAATRKSATSAPGCRPQDHPRVSPRVPPVGAAALERAARLFRAIGDPPRLHLLALLAQGEACVTELAANQREELSTISQRLRVLRAENIVARRREGKHILYSLADQHIVDLVFNALAHASERPPDIPASLPMKEKGKHA